MGSEEKIADIEDLLEKRRNGLKGRSVEVEVAEDIYRREYEEERQRFKQFSNPSRKR